MSVKTTPSDSVLELPDVSRYDLFLCLLPLPLLSGATASLLAAIPSTVGIALGSLPSLLLLLYGLFVDAPA
ncbi:hypothetical protein [Salinirubrum litoreum]|uniref:Uncharacterized protein n=1 Tax=Salinirubrum litoreum TaxID=1126234 RepID=A0ABD5R628_9EURY|nr:hypothetical protein [Salinirubrum litoreum]